MNKLSAFCLMTLAFICFASCKDSKGVDTTPILVAAKDIPHNHEITNEDCAIEQWPNNLVPKNCLNDLMDAVGRKPREPISKGEFLFQDRLSEYRWIRDPNHYRTLPPSASDRAGYSLAIKCLQDSGDRPQASKLFQMVVSQFPDSIYCDQCKKWSSELSRMIEEDQKWVEPEDVKLLSLQAQIQYYIYHIRNINLYKFGYPSKLNLIEGSAEELVEIGRPAIPFLIDLLDDSRLTRTVDYNRPFSKRHGIVEYGDVAFEILMEIAPKLPHRADYETSLFNGNQNVIHDIREWWTQSKDEQRHITK